MVHRNTLNTMAQYAYVGTYVIEQGVMKCSVLCSREGNGTLLQHSCLENPMDGGAW